MRPVIDRTAGQSGKNLCPGFKLLIRRRIAGDEPLLHTAGTHGTPPVMIALQPQLCQIAELPVLSDILRRNVIVIVKDRLLYGILMIQYLSRFCSQQKVFIHKLIHSLSLLISCHMMSSSFLQSCTRSYRPPSLLCQRRSDHSSPDRSSPP